MNKQELYNIEPNLLQGSWFAFARTSGTGLHLIPVFRDLIGVIEHFRSLLGIRRSDNYIKAMNDNAYPSIHCFCGASTHVANLGKAEEKVSYKFQIGATSNDFFQTL